MGLDADYRNTHEFCDEAKIWSQLFLNCCANGDAAQSVGAIGLGTENIVKYVYQPILGAIKNHLSISPRDRVFFDLHALLDDEHGKILNEIASDYAKNIHCRNSLRQGMLIALNLRAAFFDAMSVRAASLFGYSDEEYAATV